MSCSCCSCHQPVPIFPRASWQRVSRPQGRKRISGVNDNARSIPMGDLVEMGREGVANAPPAGTVGVDVPQLWAHRDADHAITWSKVVKMKN